MIGSVRVECCSRGRAETIDDVLCDCAYVVGHRSISIEIEFMHLEYCGRWSWSKDWAKISWSGLNNVVNDVRRVGVVEGCALDKLIETLFVHIGHGGRLEKRCVILVSDEKDSGGVVT